MKIIPEKRLTHKIWYLRLYNYHWVDTSAGGLFVPEGIVRPVPSISALTWFIIYISVIEIYNSQIM